MLFGPGARRAIETYQAAMEGEDKELLGALLLAVSTNRIMTKFKVEGDNVIAWAEDGEEVVRMPLKVPTIERTPFDPDLNVYRYNIT
jgi:nitrate reductase beta subunit